VISCRTLASFRVGLFTAHVVQIQSSAPHRATAKCHQKQVHVEPELTEQNRIGARDRFSFWTQFEAVDEKNIILCIALTFRMGFNGIYYATRGGGDLLLLSHSFFLGDF
jgi:hypothetical protein